jgi:hypothetical protein
MRRFSSHAARSTLSLILCLPLAGCALTRPQRTCVAQFAEASTAIGEFAAVQFPTLRQATIDMNLQNIALAGDAKLSDLDEAFDPDRVATRVAAARALATNGTLLHALVEDTQRDGGLRRPLSPPLRQPPR